MLPRRGESAQARRSIIMLYKKNCEREGERNSPKKKNFCFFLFFFTPIFHWIKKTSRSVWTGPTNGEPKHFQIIIKTKESFGHRDLCWRCFGCCGSMVPSSGCSSSVFSYSALFLWYINYVVSVRGLFSLPKVWLKRARSAELTEILQTGQTVAVARCWFRRSFLFFIAGPSLNRQMKLRHRRRKNKRKKKKRIFWPASNHQLSGGHPSKTKQKKFPADFYLVTASQPTASKKKKNWESKMKT